jgi:hypothetical protein
MIGAGLKLHKTYFEGFMGLLSEIRFGVAVRFTIFLVNTPQ